jgi:Ca2+-binding EF-hand superfamily protein
MNRFVLLSSAVAVALTAHAASAQTAATPPKSATPTTVPAERAAGGHEKINFLDFYDVNGDAIVTEAEFTGQRSSDYKRIDADGNGSVNDAEYVGEFTVRLDRQLAAQREGQIKQGHSRFKVLDKNKDGQITADEFDGTGKNLFAAFDSNKDGVVDEKDKAENF